MSKSCEKPDGAKAGVSISDMARAVGLSRQRFHQLVKAGVFPEPLRDGTTGRPYYDGTGQTQCAEVRRRNCGVNGKVVLFYAHRRPVVTSTPRHGRPSPDRHQRRHTARCWTGCERWGWPRRHRPR